MKFQVSAETRTEFFGLKILGPSRILFLRANLNSQTQVVGQCLIWTVWADQGRSGRLIPNDDYSKNRIGFRKNF